MLETASLNWNFKPYAATVEVSKDGEVTRAWVKQSAETEELNLDAVDRYFSKKTFDTPKPPTTPMNYNPDGMVLEIDLPDLHSGLFELASRDGRRLRLAYSKR